MAIPGNLRQSIDHKTTKSMLFHKSSCGNSCSELTQVLLNLSRVCFFWQNNVHLTLCLTSVTGHSTRTHNACRFQHQTCWNLLLDYRNGH